MHWRRCNDISLCIRLRQRYLPFGILRTILYPRSIQHRTYSPHRAFSAGFRTLIVGTSYQLGVLVASASDTIESRLSERFSLRPQIEMPSETAIYSYGTVLCIFMACAITYTILITILGPENRGRGLRLNEMDSDCDGEANDRNEIEI